MMLVDIML